MKENSKTHIVDLRSEALNREVRVTIIIPNGTEPAGQAKVLLVNDGQDFGALHLRTTVETLWNSGRADHFIIVGTHAGHDRIQEYGVADRADYAGRGSRAGATASFILNELFPYIKKTYRVEFTEVVYAGFSLGGLMALDTVWKHPDIFSAAGVFSGALWWRQRSLGEDYSDSDRIMHQEIKLAPFAPKLRFWFQCGTADETDDRDHDGIIDSIQDTLDCVAALEKKGYAWNRDVKYVEVAGGEHNPGTWGKIMPEFLEWAFPKKIDILKF